MTTKNKPYPQNITAAQAVLFQQEAFKKAEKVLAKIRGDFASLLAPGLHDWFMHVFNAAADLDDLMFEDVEYVAIPQELVEDDPKIWEKIIRFAREHGAAIQFVFDTKQIAILDDKMSPEDCEVLADLLEGHPIESVKLKVIKK